MTLNKQRTIKKLVEELEKNPLLSRACNKLGVTRSTLYRWMEDEVVREKIDSAQLLGRQYMNDFVESKLIGNINDSNQRAIEFWLKANSDQYRSSEKHLMKKIEQLEDEIEKKDAALLVATGDMYYPFVDHEKLDKFIEEIDVEYISSIDDVTYTGATAHEREVIELARDTIYQIELARRHRKVIL